MTRALGTAAEMAHDGIVQLLLEEATKRDVLYALVRASALGNLSTMDVLMGQPLTRSDYTTAMEHAASAGQVEALPKLLPHFRHEDDNGLLHIAAYQGHEDVVALVVPLSDVAAVAKGFAEYPNLPALDRLSPYLDPALMAHLVTQNTEADLPRLHERWRSLQPQGQDLLDTTGHLGGSRPKP